MTNRFKKLLSAALIFTTAAVFLPACSTASSQDISNPALVSKVTEYSVDYGSEDLNWIEESSYAYEYKDAYPVTLTRTQYEDVSVINYDYELKDGVPVSMTHNTIGDDGTLVSTSYTKKGLVNRVITTDSTGRQIGEQVFQYGNRDDYFTLVLHENVISAPEDLVVDHMEEVDSVLITSENGLLKKTVNDGLFANYNDKEKKEWRRFDGSYTANYGESGIIDTTFALFKNFPGSGNQNKYDLTIEDGRVTEVIINAWVPADTASEDDGSSDETAEADSANNSEEAASEANNEDPPDDSNVSTEGSWEPERRFVFEYTDTAISPARYAAMINYFLLEGGGNYYIYNWY